MLFGKKDDKQQVQMLPQPIPLTDIMKKAIVQVKYEEIGSWLAMHRTPLFYAHKNGFTVVDQNYIDTHKDLKKALDKMAKDLSQKQLSDVKQLDHTEKDEKKNPESYIG